MPLPAAEPTAKHFQGQNRNVPHVGGGVPTPRSTTKGKPPLPANSHAPHCRARRPRRASSNTKVKPKRSANSYPSHCRERACPFRAVHGPTWKSPGECAARLRIRPRLRKTGGLLRGAPGSARPTGSGCGFARRVALGLCCCTERRGRCSLPGLCGFAVDGIKSLPCAAGPSGRRPQHEQLRFFILSASPSQKQGFVGNVVQPVAGSAAAPKERGHVRRIRRHSP